MRLCQRLRRWAANQWLLARHTTQPLRLWVDDQGPAAPGWYHAVDMDEARDVLHANYVVELHLPASWMGHAVAEWLWETLQGGANHYPLLRPRLHWGRAGWFTPIYASLDRYYRLR